MSVLSCGGKGALERDESIEKEGGTFSEIETGNGDVLVGGTVPEMDRGLYQPCSARNLARICKARWRAASASSGLGGDSGRLNATGFDGLGAWSRTRLMFRSSSKRSS